MIRPENVYSLSDFLRNAKEHVDRLKDTKIPELLTINGKAEIVVQDAQGYQAVLDRLDRAETIAALRVGMQDVEEGRTMPVAEFVAEMRAKYGL